jgi:hypothetical protein
MGFIWKFVKYLENPTRIKNISKIRAKNDLKDSEIFPKIRAKNDLKDSKISKNFQIFHYLLLVQFHSYFLVLGGLRFFFSSPRAKIQPQLANTASKNGYVVRNNNETYVPHFDSAQFLQKIDCLFKDALTVSP